MINNFKITEQIKIENGVIHADITAERATPYFSMVGFKRAVVVVLTGTVAKDKKVTLQLMQAKDEVGTDAKALGDYIEHVVTEVAGEQVHLVHEIHARDMDKVGYTHVSCKILSDNAVAVFGAVEVLRGDSAYTPV